MPLSKVSKQFLQSIFGAAAAEASVEWWKFDASGKARGRQTARAAAATPAVDDSVYWSVGLMRPGTTRSNANVVSVHALVADDVGTKVDEGLVQTFMPEPTCVVETSPGNFQYVWAVEGGMTVAEHRALWVGMEALLGQRMDGSDQSHLFRLPEGVNGKPGKTLSRVQLRVNSGIKYTYQFLSSLFPGAPAGLRGSGSGGQTATKQAICAALDILQNDGTSVWCATRKDWIDMGMAIKGALGDAEGLQVWLDWCDQQAQGEDPLDVWEGLNPHSIGWGFIEILAKQHGGGKLAASAFDDGVDLSGPDVEAEVEALREKAPKTYDDYWAHSPSGKFISVRIGDLHPAVSVDAVLPWEPYVDAAGKTKYLAPSKKLRRDRMVDQLSWVPGRRQVLEHTAVVEGGIIGSPGWRVFNLYKKPEVLRGGSAQASLPWVAHVKRVYPDDAEWIMDWFAHRVQRPGEKINHALVLGGKQGIGKDTVVEPLVHAVGPWNFGNVRPGQLMERFNAYRKSVVLRVNEAHDLGEGQNRVKFYNTMKVLVASPPETLQVEQKGIEIYSIPNVVGVIITTNYKVDGLYLPDDDRRHYVAWSNKTASDFGAKYFEGLWNWMQGGGYAHVQAFLRERDISRFDAKAPPPKTRAFHAIAQGGKQVADDGVADALEALGEPDVFSWADFLNVAPGSVHDLAKVNARALAGKVDECGYEKVVNPANASGRWSVCKGWATIYAKRSLPVAEQRRLAETLARDLTAKAKKPF